MNVVFWCVCVISFNTIPHTPSPIFILVCVRETHNNDGFLLITSIIHLQQLSTKMQSHILTYQNTHHQSLPTSLSVCVLNPCWLTNGNQSIIHTIQSFLPPIQNYQSINGWIVVCVECDDCSEQHKHWMWCVCVMVQQQMGDGCLGVVEQMRRMDELLWMWVICGMMMMIECECVFHFNHSVHVIVVNTEKLIMRCEAVWN